MSVFDEIEKGHNEIHRLCRPGETWRMSIPARPQRDSDLILSSALDAGESLARRIEELANAWDRESGPGYRNAHSIDLRRALGVEK